MHCVQSSLVTTAFVCAAALALYACGGDSGSGGGGASPASSAVVQNSCSGSQLRDKNYFITLRTDAAEDVVVGAEKLENVPRPVFFEEVILDGVAYLGLSVPVPEKTPLGQPLQITLLAGEPEQLPTCLAQVVRTVTSADDRILVTELHEIPPTIGLWPDGAEPHFAAACEDYYQMELNATEKPTQQLRGSVCYSGSAIKLKYDVASETLEWTSGNPSVFTVSSRGLVSARGNGQVPVSAQLRNAHGAAGVSVNGVPPGLPVVSMSNIELEEGSGGIKQASFTIQVATPDGAPADVPLLIDYSTQSASAVAGSDYCASSLCNSAEELIGVATIAPGQLKSDPIRFYVIGDHVPEPDERFFVNLSSQFASANPQKAEIKLINDDGPASQLFANGVGFENRTTGQISIRAPVPGDAAFLIWNQRDARLSKITITNDTLQTRASVTAADVISSTAATPADYIEQCFVARVPTAVFASSAVPADGSFTVSSTEILDGVGMVVVSGLAVQNNLRLGSGEFGTFASFSDQQSDVLSHRVELKAGCDFFYFNSHGHENSEVVSFALDGAKQDRIAKLTLMTGDSGLGRGSEILFWAGAAGMGAPKTLQTAPKCETGMVATGCASIIGSDLMPDRPALIGNNGKAWDTFGRHSGSESSAAPGPGGTASYPDPDLRGVIVIPAGATSASFQIISPRQRNGESATLMLMALEIVAP